jgi:hypothetical protein
MTFLPIVVRELRVASRRRNTYWGRVGAAGAVVLLGGFTFLSAQGEPSNTVGQLLFGIMAGAVVLFSLCSGLTATADCISQEKREGTLGLLFLTDLNGADVVLGKLAATSLNAVYGMLAVLPVLAVPLLLGGLTGAEFWRMALVVANTLFFSLAIGMLASSMNQSARRALAETIILLVFFAGALPLLGVIVSAYARTRWEWLFCLASPGYAFAYAFDANYKMGAGAFWIAMAVIAVLGLLSLLVACVTTPRAWQDRPAGARTMRWRERWLNWSYGEVRERGEFRARLLDRNACYWLCARARLKPALVWGVLGILACLWAWGAARFKSDWLHEVTFTTTGILLGLLLKFWVGLEAGRQLAEDRKAGSLELILSTPLSVPEILNGQALALLRQFLGPVLVVIACDLLFLLKTVSGNAGMQSEWSWWLSYWFCSIVLLVADLVALYWVGLWQGLTSRSPNRAAIESLVRVLVVPSVLWGLILVGISAVAIFARVDLGWVFMLGLWMGLGLAADIGFALYSRNKLLTQFRVAAEQRFDGKSSWWRLLAWRRKTEKADLTAENA